MKNKQTGGMTQLRLLIEANLSLVTVAERFRSQGFEIRTTADRRTVELRTD
jgi:hypothetical protein